MKKTFFSRGLSAILAVFMVASSMVVTALPTVAAESETPVYTAPEIVVEGEVSVWDKSTYTQPTKTDADGYVRIESADEFAWWIQNTVAGDATNYRLYTHVDMASYTFLRDTNRVFEGIFDGNGYVVSNLKASNKDSAGTAEHAYIFYTVSGTIQDLTINGFTTSITSGNSKAQAIINDLNGGKLLNIRVHVTIASTSAGAPLAIYASNGALIDGCVSSGSITATTQSSSSMSIGAGAGIVVCVRTNSTVQNCVNYATVSASNSGGAGGIASHLGDKTANGGVVRNCVNYGTISHTNASKEGIVGGIVAITFSPDNQYATEACVIGCVNYGTVYGPEGGKSHAHGIAACYAHDKSYVSVMYKDCVNYGTISAGSNAGGIASTMDYCLDLVNCINYGAISAPTGNAGGLAGFVDGNASQTSRPSYLRLQNCANYGTVEGKNAGGFAGTVVGHEKSTNDNGLYIYNSVSAGTVTGTSVGSAAGYLNKRTSTASYFTLELENVFLNGVIAGSTSAYKISRITIGDNVYLDKSSGNICGELIDNETFAAAVQYSATDMASGTYTALLNAYVNGNTEDAADTLWYQSTALGAPAPVTNLKVSRASVSIGTTPAIAVLLSGVSGLPSDAQVELVNSQGKAVTATKVDGSRYRFDFGIALADIGLTDTYHIMVNGQKSIHSYELSVAGLLGSLYAKATDAEKGLMVAMVNYSYYAGNTSAFDTFNAAAGTAFAPSVDGAAAIAGAGDNGLSAGYEAALDIEKGFIIIVTKDGEEISKHTKSVLNATVVINLGDAGTISVAAMLNHYLGDPVYADLAKAAILFYEAAVAAQDEATLGQ